MSFVNSTALANLSVSEWLGIISALALMGVFMLSLYNLIYGSRDRKIKKIDDQLLTLYYPYHKALINFDKKLPATRKIDTIEELEFTFRDIESKTIHKLDYNVNQTRIQFLGAPNENTLSNFIGAVKIKMEKLETERKKYE